MTHSSDMRKARGIIRELINTNPIPSPEDGAKLMALHAKHSKEIK